MTKKELMYENIKKHGENLNKIFNTKFDPITLCKRLRRLENKAHKIATDWCNGENGVNSDNIDSLTEPILMSVKKILGENCPVIFNGDARGYTLKLSDSWVRDHKIDIYRDWGGYGILAPDFTQNN